MNNCGRDCLKNRLSVVLFCSLLFSAAHSYAESDDAPPMDGDQAAQQQDELLRSQPQTALVPKPKLKPTPPISSNGTAGSSLQNEVVFEKLNAITESIKALEEKHQERVNLLNKAKTEKEKETIQNEIDAIDQSIKDQENTFALIQTGGLNFSKVEDSEDKTFDWQKNLLEILQPIMNELHEYTEVQRRVLQLHNKIAFYQTQIEDSNKALEKMGRINQDGLEPAALDKFMQTKSKWEDLLADSQHQLEFAQIQLDGILASEREDTVSIGDHLKQFAYGRGATILITVLGSLAVFFVMLYLWKGILWLMTWRQGGKLSYFQRLSNLIYHVITVLFTIATIFYILNLRNDQVLVGIAVLVLVITIWALKNSVPRYIHELQTMLNAGPVREGERILYHGIPMKIERLNFFSKLINPAIPSLRVKLPLSELNGYVSRPYSQDEPWFPCKVGDYVLFSDGWCLKVNSISLEYVQLAMSNDTMPMIYSIQEFIDARPRNLSLGFVVVSVIGIDYQYQSKSTTEIPDLFQQGILDNMQKESYASALLSVSVYFEQANSSSLDYKIVASFDGSVASDYYAIKRDLQRFAVDVCNRQQWTIPFNQLVVHSAGDG